MAKRQKKKAPKKTAASDYKWARANPAYTYGKKPRRKLRKHAVEAVSDVPSDAPVDDQAQGRTHEQTHDAHEQQSPAVEDVDAAAEEFSADSFLSIWANRTHGSVERSKWKQEVVVRENDFQCVDRHFWGHSDGGETFCEA